MYKKILIIFICFLSISCVMLSKKYKPQPIVVKEIVNYLGAIKAGSLSIYAEEYKSQTGVDFSKAGLKVVLLTLQNTSQSQLPSTHQLISREIHGIGSAEYMPYPFPDAIALMSNSEATKEGAKGAVMGTATGAAIGATVGTILGAIGGDAGTGAAVGAVLGGATGGVGGVGHYKDKMMQAIVAELQSRVLPEIVTVYPNSKLAGILFYPQDTHSLSTNIEGKTYNIEIHQSK